MYKTIYTILLATITYNTFADDTTAGVVNVNSQYINKNAYLQDPYAALPSAGGNQTVSESTAAGQNVAQKLFTDGTWNDYSGAYAMHNVAPGADPYNMFGYGTNLFGQTGQIAGFSFGGLFTAANPFFSNEMNGSHVYGNPFQPANQQINVPEAFAEYQYNNIVQVDAGWIGINNSPWLQGNYLNNTLTPPATYQGALVNIAPGAGWLLTAIAFDGAQISGNDGFNKQTFYNTGLYDGYAGFISNANVHSGGSENTMAVGANYSGWDNNETLRLWAYQFNNYGTLLYADNTIKLKATQNLGFTIGVQGGVDNSWANDGANALTNNDPTISGIASNFVGMEGAFNYKWVGLTLAYNKVWGGSSSYGGGGIISPYTYSVATDPLYTTPYMAGLVDMGTAGSAYKIAPTFSFLDSNLVISPTYTYFSTAVAQWNGTQEYDLTAAYSIPQIRGLSLFADYSYQQLAIASNSSWTTSIFVGYNY